MHVIAMPLMFFFPKLQVFLIIKRYGSFKQKLNLLMAYLFMHLTKLLKISSDQYIDRYNELNIQVEISLKSFNGDSRLCLRDLSRATKPSILLNN